MEMVLIAWNNLIKYCGVCECGDLTLVQKGLKDWAIEKWTVNFIIIIILLIDFNH